MDPPPGPTPLDPAAVDARRHKRACAHLRAAIRIASDRYDAAWYALDAAGNSATDYPAAAAARLRQYTCVRRLDVIREIDPGPGTPAAEVAELVAEWEAEKQAIQRADAAWAGQLMNLHSLDDLIRAGNYTKRADNEWRCAPCPVCRQGEKDAAWLRRGDKVDVLAGCNRCAPSGGTDYLLALLDALGLRAAPQPPRVTGAAPSIRTARPARAASAAAVPGGDDDPLWEWAAFEALPASGLPADVEDAARRAVKARAVKDAKGETCRDKDGHSLLSPRQMADGLADLAACDGWRGMDTLTRSLLDTLLETAKVWPRLRMVTIGQANRGGGWRDPSVPARGDVDNDEPQTLLDVSADPAVPVAAGLLFRGRLGLLHGPSFGGKSTLLGNVLARIVTGRPWLGRPTIAGDVIAVVEEAATYAHTVRQAGGELARVHLRRWRELPRAAADIKPAAIIVDTMQRIAHEIGGLNLNQPDDTDRILRVLEAIARDNDCAVLVTDHEPYEEGKSGTKDRPRGSTAKPATVDYVLRCLRDDTETTVTPGRGMARFGIDVFAFAVDVRGEPVAVSSDDAPFEGAGSAKRGSRLDPDGYLWPDPEIDDPLRAWFVANVADGKAPSWTQCRKRIRKETQIGAGNDRLKKSYDRVSVWFERGGPDRATPTPADRPDRPVRESADRPGPLGRTAPDRPVRTARSGGGPPGPDPIGGPAVRTAGPGPPHADRLRTDPAPAEPLTASGDDTDRAAGGELEPRGRIAFRDNLPDGAHHRGCTLPADHGGPCWIPEPPPEPLTAAEYEDLERLPRVPAIVNGDTPVVRRYNALRMAHGLAPVSLDAQPGDREELDASRFFERLAETARRADLQSES